MKDILNYVEDRLVSEFASMLLRDISLINCLVKQDVDTMLSSNSY